MASLNWDKMDNDSFSKLLLHCIEEFNRPQSAPLFMDCHPLMARALSSSQISQESIWDLARPESSEPQPTLLPWRLHQRVFSVGQQEMRLPEFQELLPESSMMGQLQREFNERVKQLVEAQIFALSSPTTPSASRTPLTLDTLKQALSGTTRMPESFRHTILNLESNWVS
jgi:hypothetical protein